MNMRRMSGWFPTVAAAIFAGLGCESDENEAALRESLDTWKAWQGEHDDTYFYETGAGSWTGSGSDTYILVENGVVTARLFRQYDSSETEPGVEVVTDVYIERGDSVGQHDAGATPLTIEALYDACSDDVLGQDPDDNDIYLEFRDDGILDTCVYVPKNCADDCSTGVQIFDLRADIDAFEALVDEVISSAP